jgi:hypothetical protein
LPWYDAVFELIDMRSFSNLWFWIALAVVWSSASHWVVGVPWDQIQRAMRKGGEAQADVETLVRIYCKRLIYIGRVSGLWILGLSSAILTGLAILGFFYRVEFAQALFLIAFPLALVGGLSLRTARQIDAGALVGAPLHEALKWHRRWVQLVGIVAIFITAMWGMYQNMNLGPLGA